jgi:hypothetical protein
MVCSQALKDVISQRETWDCLAALAMTRDL